MSELSSVLTKLHGIATALSHPVEGQRIRDVFPQVFPALLELFDVDHSTVTLLDEERRFFVVEAEHPQLATSLVGEPIPTQDRAAQHSLVDLQEPVVADDLNAHSLISESSSFRQVAQSLDIRSLLIVPIVSSGCTIGTISLDTIGRRKSFSSEEVQLCQTVASQAAAFIAISRLLDEQRKYRRQAELLASPRGRTDLAEPVENIARTLIDELKKVIVFRKASLQLIVDGGRKLVGTFGFDKSRSDPKLLRPIEGDPIIREIVQTRKRKILANTAHHSDWEGQVDTVDVNSWIGMPLIFRGTTIGVLTLDHDQAGFYGNISEDVLSRVDVLVDHAAQDVGNAYCLQGAQLQGQAVDIIRRFAETVATELDPRKVLHAAVSVISRGLECTACNIFLVEQRDQHDSLVCRAVCRESSCTISSGPVLPNPGPGQLLCPVHHAFQHGNSALVHDRKHDSSFDFTHELYQGARSMVAVPLKIGHQVIGSVLAMHERSGWFSGADMLLLETLARQAASAIERDYGLALVNSIVNKMLGATKVDAVLKDLVAGTIKLIHADSGVIYELNDDGSRIVRSFSQEGSVHPTPRLDHPQGITRTVITTKKPVEITDTDQDGRVHPDLRGKYRSMFAWPLLLEQSVVGVLFLNGKNVRELSETERSLLDTLAGHAALAIQRTRLHEQIRDSDAMYRSLIDHIPQFVFRKDRNSRFTWANKSFCATLGKSLEEIRGKSDVDFYSRVNAAWYVRGDLEVMHTKRAVTFEEEHQPPGGNPKMLVRVVKTPVLDFNGEVTGVQAIFWDITKEVEEKKLAERWRVLAEQSPDGIIVHRNGKITLANPAAVRLYGAASASELIDRTIVDFFDERSRPLAEKRLQKLEKGEAVEPMLEMCVVRKDGEKVDVEVYTRLLPETGEAQAVFHDLTRTKELLREMHHRLRRSLNQIDGFLFRQEDFTQDRDVLHAFSTLRERIQAMALVHMILYETRKESDVMMDLYLGRLKEAIRTEHGGPAKQITFDFTASGIVLNEKQATACGLIVTELVSNSLLHAFRKAKPPASGWQVLVSLRADGDKIRMIVSDNGVGMQPSVLKGADTMGLSLVRSLVKNDLKGEIRISIDSGTCFTIDFRCTERMKGVGNGG